MTTCQRSSLLLYPLERHSTSVTTTKNQQGSYIIGRTETLNLLVAQTRLSVETLWFWAAQSVDHTLTTVWNRLTASRAKFTMTKLNRNHTILLSSLWRFEQYSCIGISNTITRDRRWLPLWSWTVKCSTDCTEKHAKHYIQIQLVATTPIIDCFWWHCDHVTGPSHVVPLH